MSRRELRLFEVRVNPAGEPPLVTLEEIDGNRLLPIWTNFDGATAVVLASENLGDDEEPGTPHEFICKLLKLFKHSIVEIEIIEFNAGQFKAEILIDDQRLAVRPTDAIAISELATCPIYCTDQVMEQAGILPLPAQEVERFVEFLESVDPTDFQADQQ